MSIGVSFGDRNPLCSSRKEKRPFTQKFLQSLFAFYLELTSVGILVLHGIEAISFQMPDTGFDKFDFSERVHLLLHQHRLLDPALTPELLFQRFELRQVLDLDLSRCRLDLGLVL